MTQDGGEVWRRELQRNDPSWSWLIVPEAEGFDLSMPTWVADIIIADHADAIRLKAALEPFEDLLDWATRWQAGRRENTRLKEVTPTSRQGNLMARVILEAKAMNEELDLILAALSPTTPNTEEAKSDG